MKKTKSTSKKNKFNAVKQEYNGITFDSKRECERYKVLLGMLERGEIENLELQKKYLLIPAFREPSTYGARGGEKKGKLIERECTYIADFTYTKDGNVVVEDVKGYRDPQSSSYAKFTIKRKLMLEKYGIRVIEV